MSSAGISEGYKGISLLDDAIKKAKLTDNAILTRGVSDLPTTIDEAQKMIGETIGTAKDGKPISTSVKSIQNWGTSTIEIKADEGTQGMYVAVARDSKKALAIREKDQKTKTVSGEGEFLLPSDTKIEITGVRMGEFQGKPKLIYEAKIVSTAKNNSSNIFTKFDNESGKLIEIKAKDYNDFKEKYWKTLDKVEKQSNNVSVKKSFTEKLNEIKEKAKARGGFIESDMHEAGKAIIEDSEVNEKIDRIGQLDNESNKNSQRFSEIFKKYGYDKSKYPDDIQEEATRINARNIEIWNERSKLTDEIKRSVRDKIKSVSPRASSTDFNADVLKYDPTGEVSDTMASRKAKFVKESIDEAVEFYPKSWVKNLPDYEIHYRNRGYNSSVRNIIGISNGGARTAVHELGHGFEKIKPEILKLEKEFYDRRTAGETLQWLGKGYDKNEVARKDSFIDKYMGKDYGGKFYELVSMGFEMAYNNPQHLMRDTDYAEFILGILTLIE